MLLKIARRNIWRSKKRSITLLIAISLGLWSGMFLIALYNGMIEQRVQAAIQGEISHIQIHHPEFLKDHDPEFNLEYADTLINHCKQQASVKAVSGRRILFGMIASPIGANGIKINGVDPGTEDQLTGITEKLIAGHYFDSSKSYEIILSESLCQKLKLNLNKKTILSFQDKEGNLISAAFRIAGIFKTFNGPYDENNVFVNRYHLDELMGTNNTINEIALLLYSNNQLTHTIDDLKIHFPSVDVKSWMEIAPEIGFTVSAGSQMVYIYMGIILLALMFGIINTMMMSVLERKREIGMLLALGMNKLRIFLMILWETCFLILAGCPVGILLAFLTIKITHHRGIDFSQYAEVYSNFGYNSTVYPVLHVDQFAKILIMIVFTAIISSLFPAQRALKIKPVTAIKN